MSATVKKKDKEFAEVQTSKDGRRYVNVADVLESSAGREEIRRNAETFRVLRGNKTNGSHRDSVALNGGSGGKTGNP